MNFLRYYPIFDEFEFLKILFEFDILGSSPKNLKQITKFPFQIIRAYFMP